MDTAKLHLFSILLCLHVTVSTELEHLCPTNGNDPCTQYNTLHDNNKSRSPQSQTISGTYEADYALIQRWYRSPAPNVDMPVYPPMDTGSCYTSVQIWLNDTYPTNKDGIVEKKACVRAEPNSCVESFSICLKHCGDYNVYYLKTSMNSLARYCFGPHIPDTTTTTSTYVTKMKTSTTSTTFKISILETKPSSTERTQTPITTEGIADTSEEENDLPPYIIIIVVVLVVIFLIGIVFGCVCCCCYYGERKNNQSSTQRAYMEARHHSQATDNVYDHPTTLSTIYDDDYVKPITTRPDSNQYQSIDETLVNKNGDGNYQTLRHT